MSAGESDVDSGARTYRHIEYLGHGEELAQDLLSHISKPGHDIIIFPADQSVHLVYDPQQAAKEDGENDE